MKLPVIRKLADQHTLEDLKAAETALYEELKPEINIEGADEGEQLTHVLGAIWIKEAMAAGADPSQALREYAQKVRNSIG